MSDNDIWELVNVVGYPEHLAVVEGFERQPDNPVEYANRILAEAEWPPLTENTFKARVRKLVNGGILTKNDGTLTLTDRGREALELWLYWPEKKKTAVRN